MSRLLLLTLLCVLSVVPFAYGGSPHFVACSQTISGNTVTVEGKEAGLGNETDVHIEVTATAVCQNRGGNRPEAANKQSVTAEGLFPVMNGKAVFLLELEATFSPECSPPMEIIFTDVTACDVEHDVCCTL